MLQKVKYLFMLFCGTKLLENYLVPTSLHESERCINKRSYFEVTRIQVLQENLNIITNSVLYI